MKKINNTIMKQSTCFSIGNFIKLSSFVCLLTVLLSFALFTANGQAVGDYGSSGNINWLGGTWNVCTSAGTWTGATTTTVPPTASTNVWILSGNTVTTPTYISQATTATGISTASLTVTLSAANSSIAVGQYVFGAGIAPGTVVTAYSSSTPSITVSILPTTSSAAAVTLGFSSQPASVVTTQATSATGENGTTTVTLSAANASIAVGQVVFGSGILPGTTVSAISSTTLTLSKAATTSITTAVTLSFCAEGTLATSQTASATGISNTTTITLSASNSSILVGQPVFGPYIAAGTYVSAINGVTLTLSTAATASSTTTGTLSFGNLLYCNNLNVAGTFTQTIGTTVNGTFTVPTGGVVTNSQTFNVVGNSSITGTVTLSGNFNTSNLVINTGGVFKASTPANTTVYALSLNGNTLTVNGQLGAVSGSSIGTSGDGIRMFYCYSGSGSTTISGSGTIAIARLAPAPVFNALFGNPPSGNTANQDLQISMNMEIRSYANNAPICFSLLNGNQGSAVKTMTINSGYTVKLDGGQYDAFHVYYTVAPIPYSTYTTGNITYTINGTLDLSPGTGATGYAPFNLATTGASGNTSSLTVAVGSSGILKLGSVVRLYKAFSGQSINVTVADGGIIDNSGAALSTTTSNTAYNSINAGGVTTLAAATSNAAGTTITVGTAGAGYTVAPYVVFTGGTCTTYPTGTATVSGGAITGITTTGASCTAAPTVYIVSQQAPAQYFAINGASQTGVIKELTVSGSTTPVWIGGSSEYNPITINPTTGSVTTVSVQDIQPTATSGVTNGVVDKIWTISQATASAATIGFGYQSTTEGTGDVSSTPLCNPTASMSLVSGTTNGSWSSASGSSSTPSTSLIAGANEAVSFSANSFSTSTLFAVTNTTQATEPYQSIANSDWATTSTWQGAAVPSTTGPAIIATNVTINTTGTTTIANLTVNSGETLTIASGATLNITGNAIINGTINGAGTVLMNTASSTISGTGSILNLNISTTTITLASNFSVTSLNVLSGGTFADGGYTLTNSGNLVVAGTHTSTSSGEIKMTGASTTISGGGIVGTLEIAPGSGNTVTVSTAPSVIKNLILTSGILTDGGNEIKVTGNVTGTGTESGTGRITMSYVTSQAVGTTQGSASATVTLSAANSSIVVGQTVFGGSVVYGGTTVSAISGTTLTLSGAGSAALTAGTILYFSTTHTFGSASGTMTIGNFATSSTGLTTAVGNVIISGDFVALSPATTGNNNPTIYNDGGYITGIGGNFFNYGSQKANLLSNATGSTATGKVSLIGTATSSGLISTGTVSAGSTSGFAVGDTVYLTYGATYGVPAKATVTTLSGSTVTAITVFDPGSGYTAVPTGFVAHSGSGTGTGTLTTAVIATSTSTKYINIGISVYLFNNLELANTAANNTVSNGKGFNVQGTLDFASAAQSVLGTSGGNTSGTFTFTSTTSSVYIGGNVSNTNNATAAAITMASTNYFIGGTSGSPLGGIFAVSSGALGPIYFSPTANVISILEQNTNNTGNMTIGNAVVSSTVNLYSSANLVVGSGGNLTLPATVSITGSGAIDATNSNATITLANATTIASGTFVSSSVGNLTVTNAAPTLNQTITVTKLTLNATTTATSQFVTNGNLTIASAGSIVYNKTNSTGYQTLDVAPTFSGTVSVSYTGGTAITTGYELPTASGVISTLTINNSGAKVTMNAALTTTSSSTLALTSGKLVIGGNNLVLGTGSSITGASSGNYILSSGGTLTFNGIAPSASATFPVGFTNSGTDYYTPLTITNADATNTANITANAVYRTTAVNTSTGVINVQWSALASPSVSTNITFNYTSANFASGFSAPVSGDLGQYNGSSYINTYSSVSIGATATSYSGLTLPASGTNQFILGNTGAVVAATYTTWTGGTSTDWATASNWNGGTLPTSTLDAIIPSGTTYAPLVAASTTVQVNSLTVNSGATVTLGSGANITVNGASIINNGTIAGSSGILNLASTSTGQSITGTGSVYNLTVNNTNGVSVTSGTQTVSGTVLLTAGTFTLASSSLIVNGSVTLSGGNFAGSAPKYGTAIPVTYTVATTTGNELTPATGTVGALTISASSSTVTLGSAATVTGLALTAGTLADGGHTLTNSGNISGTGTHTSTGSGEIKLTGASTTISATTFGSLEIASTSGTATLTGAISIAGNLILTSGTLADGGYVITLSGNVGNNGTGGVHSGTGRLYMNSTATTPTIAGGVTFGNLYQHTTNTIAVNGNITVSNDVIFYKPSGTAFSLGANVMTVGGNITNVGGNYGIFLATTGKVSMTGTCSTMSGVTNMVVTSGGTGYTNGDIITFTNANGTSAQASIGVTSGVIVSVTMLDPGTGYTTVPSSTTFTQATGTGTGAAITCSIAATTSNKVIGAGNHNVQFTNLEFANTVANNTVTLAPQNSRVVFVTGTLDFAAGNTSGKFVLSATPGSSTPCGLTFGTALGTTTTAPVITMASSNSISTAAASAGKITVFGTSALSGSIYFDQTTPGTTNSLYALVNTAGGETIGNNLVVGNTLTLTAGTVTVPASTTLTIGGTTNVTTVSGVINATTSTSTIALTAATTIPSGMFSPSTIGNLVITNAAPTLNQAITVSNSLTMNSTTAASYTIANGSYLTIGSGATVTRNKTGTGKLALGTVPTFSSLSATNFGYTGSVLDTIGNEMPVAANTINTLTINNSGNVTMKGYDITTSGALALTSGNLVTGNNNVIAGSISGGIASSYVLINGSGTLKSTASSGVAKLYPVGTRLGYTPLIITPSATQAYTVGLANNSYSIIPGDTTQVLKVQWSLLGSTAATTATVKYGFNPSLFSTGYTVSASELGVNTGSGWSIVPSATSITPTTDSTNYYSLSATSVSIPNSGSNYYVIGNKGNVVVTSTQWAGTVSTDWGNYLNWTNNVPTASDSAVVVVASNQPLITASESVKNINIASGVTITNNGTLNIVSKLINNGTITGTGTNILNGTALQAISGTGIVGNLTVNNSHGVTVSSGSNSLGISGVLTLQSGTLTTNGNVTLKSLSIANSGVLAPYGVSGNTGTISGNVTVERYIPAGYRGYRDLAPQVYNSSNTMFNSWQENGSFTHNGYGIFITGPTSTDATLTDYASGQIAANSTTGLDYSLNGISSAYTYGNGTWPAITNTKTTTLDPLSGYRVLVRGDRSFNLATTPILIYPAGLRMYNATTLRATGSLVTGTVTYSTTGVTGTANGSAITSTNALNANATVISNGKITQGLSMVANPYACPVSWTSVYNNSVSAGSNINGTWYFLDPTYSATGTYEGYNYATGSQFSDETNASDLIQAGQAFFVLNATTSPTPMVVFEESAKQATSTKLSIFGAAAPLSKIYIGIYKETNGSYTRTDGAAVAFRSDFTDKSFGTQDALKVGYGSDYIAISDKGVNLGIDGRLPATASDAVALKIGSPTATSYQLQVDASRYINEGFAPLLYDAYKNTTTALGSAVTTVNFTVDASTAASYANRFTIIFTPSALAVNSIVASATLNDKIATITWNTVGEKGESYFEAEKSTDGKNFTSIGQQAAKNTSTASYTATDNSVVEGNNYYRIKAVSETGSIAYSNVAKVQLTVNSNQFTVYPNPLVGKTLNVSLSNVAAGKYVVSIYNVLGEKVVEQAIVHEGGSATHAISIDNTLAGGVYSLVIREASSNQIVHQASISVQP